MRHPANNQGLRHGRQRGTSLVEVLVVLVILVLGIFSIARLFPGGFIAVRNAENSTFADRLGQGQLEGLKQNNAFLLDAVYMYQPDGSFNAAVGPDDLTDNYPNTANPDPAYRDINKTRYVQNESFTVPTLNTALGTPTNGLSVHVLTYGPVALPLQQTLQQITSPSAPPGVRGLPPINSGPWAAKTGNSQQEITSGVTGNYDAPGDLIAPGQQNYAIDYNGQQIALPTAPYPQSFTLIVKMLFTLSPSGNAAQTQAVITYYVPLLIPAANPNQAGDSASAYNGGWFNPFTAYVDTNRLPAPGQFVTDLPPPNGNSSTPPAWVPGAATLMRTLLPEPPGNPLTTLKNDSDPYKYVLYNSDTSLANVAPGVLVFNPRIAGQRIAVSYLAYDWHIIHDDVDVPTTAGTPVRLTLNHLRRVGDVLSDQSIYNGMFRTGDAANPYDVVVLDTDTGDMAGLSVTDTTDVFDLDNATGTSTPNQVVISYQAGRITLPTDTNSKWYYGNHKHLRVFYEGDEDWGVAIQKAPSVYTRNDAGLTPANGLTYPILVGQYAVDAATQNIYFPRCDSGKTVELDNVVYYDTAGKQYAISNIVLAISTATSDTSPDQTDASGNVVSGVRAGGSPTQNLGSYLAVDNTANPVDPSRGIQIGDVRGVSARAVVIWRERGLWKTRAIDTILTRAQ